MEYKYHIFTKDNTSVIFITTNDTGVNSKLRKLKRKWFSLDSNELLNARFRSGVSKIIGAFQNIIMHTYSNKYKSE